MKYQTFRFAVGECSCTFEDPGQGKLRLSLAELNAQGGLFAEAPLLDVDAYVDASLECENGAKIALFAQVIKGVERGTFALRWIHSDPLGESHLDNWIKKCAAAGATDPLPEDANDASQETSIVESSADMPEEESVEEPVVDNGKPATGTGTAEEAERKVHAEASEDVTPQQSKTAANSGGTAPPPESSTSAESEAASQSATGEPPTPIADKPQGVVVVADQVSPQPIAESLGASDPKSFKFSHIVQGASPAPVRKSATSTAKNSPADDEDSSGVAASLRRKAKMVRASDLAARHENVRVLNESTVKHFIEASVAEAAGKMGRAIGEEERQRLLEEAEEGFQERLEAFQAEKAGLEAQTKHLNDQLTKAQSLLDEERQRVVSKDQFTVSDAGMVEIEKRLGRMLERAIKADEISPQLADDMRNVLETLLDEERDKISAKAKEAQNDQIELLERKIQRLATSLESTEKDRDSAQRRAQALEEAGGIGLRNVIRAGMTESDPNKDRKLDLLKTIFKENKDMRAQMKSIPKKSTQNASGAPGESVKLDTNKAKVLEEERDPVPA